VGQDRACLGSYSLRRRRRRRTVPRPRLSRRCGYRFPLTGLLCLMIFDVPYIIFINLFNLAKYLRFPFAIEVSGQPLIKYSEKPNGSDCGPQLHLSITCHYRSILVLTHSSLGEGEKVIPTSSCPSNTGYRITDAQTTVFLLESTTNIRSIKLHSRDSILGTRLDGGIIRDGEAHPEHVARVSRVDDAVVEALRGDVERFRFYNQ